MHNDKTEPRRPDIQPPDYYDDAPSGPGCLVWSIVVLFGAILAVAIVGLAAFAGFNEGVDLAKSTATSVQERVVSTQCASLSNEVTNNNAGLIALRYEDWTENNNLPACAISLAPEATRIYLESIATETPTPTLTATTMPSATPTVTLTVAAPIVQTSPTADTSSAGMTEFGDLNVLLEEARVQYQTEEYEEAIRTLDAIAAADPTFQTAEVNNLLFQSLTREATRLFRGGGNLARAITLANRANQYGDIGNLGGEITVAQYYLQAQRFIDIDYGRAIYWLNQVRVYSNNYRDTNTLLFQQLEAYGDAFALGGEPCRAVEQYNAALALRAAPTVQTKLTTAQQACSGIAVPTQDPNNPNAPIAQPTEGESVAPIGQR